MRVLSTRRHCEGEPLSRPNPFERSGFNLFRPIPLRWADIDRYGHANNVAYLSWFDTAVNDWYAEQGWLANTNPHFIVAQTGCTFFREVTFSDEIAVAIRAKRIGRTSVTYDLAVFVGDEPTARAQGEYVHVLVSDQTKLSVPITGRIRDVLASLGISE